MCSFTLLSTHRDGPLQIGVTTSGRGCKLASRIRREIAAFLPKGTGSAVNRLGLLRRRIREEDQITKAKPCQRSKRNTICVVENVDEEDNDDEAGNSVNLNKLVHENDAAASKTRRMRWLSQMCEYWPLNRLVSVSDEEIEALLKSYMNERKTIHNGGLTSNRATADTLGAKFSNTSSFERTRDGSLDSHEAKGAIILAGSGPGHPSLLTVAAHEAIKTADLILADKLVPSQILDLVPRRTKVHIARKFPGNADAAQDELLSLGLAALQPTTPHTTTNDHSCALPYSNSPRGKTVLRLKQGDPFLFGRGAEEVAFFRSHGYNPVVIPGVTSALAAPLFASIPPTHRGVADHVLVCTGTGRKGALPQPPEWKAGRTVVFLMALHRIGMLVESLVGPLPADLGEASATNNSPSPNDGVIDGDRDIRHQQHPDEEKTGNSTKWPRTTPCAVVERASCPDQRVIRTTLAYVCDAVQENGSRPPGLLVVGDCCSVLEGDGLGKGGAENGAEKWVVEEGYRDLDWVGRGSGVLVVGDGNDNTCLLSGTEGGCGASADHGDVDNNGNAVVLKRPCPSLPP